MKDALDKAAWPRVTGKNGGVNDGRLLGVDKNGVNAKRDDQKSKCFLDSPTDDKLYCVRTQGETWISYRWYAFVDQPELTNVFAALPAGERQAAKCYMQQRIARLHEWQEKSRARWFTPPQGDAKLPQDLVSFDPALLLTPPPLAVTPRMTAANDLPDSEAGWMTVLSPNQFAILRSAATEPPGYSAETEGELEFELQREYRTKYPQDGAYACVGCGVPLYHARQKFSSGCGWPAFYDGVEGAIDLPGVAPRDADKRHGVGDGERLQHRDHVRVIEQPVLQVHNQPVPPQRAHVLGDERIG